METQSYPGAFTASAVRRLDARYQCVRPRSVGTKWHSMALAAGDRLCVEGAPRADPRFNGDTWVFARPNRSQHTKPIIAPGRRFVNRLQVLECAGQCARVAGGGLGGGLTSLRTTCSASPDSHFTVTVGERIGWPDSAFWRQST
jgi:hypothetical protein